MAEAETCARPGCGKPIERHKGRGRPRKYCSTECQQTHYAMLHPRIDLTEMPAERVAK
jgi:hypothetical protein